MYVNSSPLNWKQNRFVSEETKQNKTNPKWPKTQSFPVTAERPDLLTEALIPYKTLAQMRAK